MALPKIDIVLKPRGPTVEIDGKKVDHVGRIRADHVVGDLPSVTIEIISDDITVNGVAATDIIEGS
jgi:hypothetical protein